MSPFGIFSIFSRLASIYALFAALVLSTLWVSSLTLLSTRASSTELIADAGAEVLNTFLYTHGPEVGFNDLGLTPAQYQALKAQAQANPTKPIAMPKPFQGTFLGSDIAGKPDDVGLHNIYSVVGGRYYDGGFGAAIDSSLVPDQLKQALPNFGLFNPNSIPIAPGGPTATQLPPFLQPLFTVIGLTPDTFTASGHQNLLNLLPFFWLATVVTGVGAFLLKRSQDGQKLSGIAHSIIHTTWPVVAVLLALLLVAPHISAIASTVAPLEDMIGVVSRSFLPVYGAALVVGLLALFVPKILANRSGTTAQQPVPVAARVGAAQLMNQSEMPFGAPRMSSEMPQAPVSSVPPLPTEAAPTPQSTEPGNPAGPMEMPPSNSAGEG